MNAQQDMSNHLRVAFNATARKQVAAFRSSEILRISSAFHSSPAFCAASMTFLCASYRAWYQYFDARVMKTFKCSKSLSNIKKNIFTILGRPLTFLPQKNPSTALSSASRISFCALSCSSCAMRAASESCISLRAYQRWIADLSGGQLGSISHRIAILCHSWTLLNGENDWKLWNLGGQWRSHILRYTNIYGIQMIQREFAAGYHFMKRCSDRRLPDWQVDCCNVNMGFAL